MKGFYIPEDTDLPPIFIEVPGDDYNAYRALFGEHGIEFPERVTTVNGKNNGFVTVVDNDSANGTHYLNRRATELSGYPGQLFGDVVFLSEEWVEDGIDFVTLSPLAETHFTEYLSTL